MDPLSVSKIKRKAAKEYKVSCPSNIKLLKAYHYLIKKGKVKPSCLLEAALRTRPVRSLSGIVNISVLTKPYPCPGKCIYCPTEKGIAKSYVSGEPAVERAKKLNFNPYLQVKKRIEMLEEEGHPTDKIELRIIGGTWSFYPQKYRNWFVKRCFDACNKKNGGNLKKSQKINETAKHRIVGLSAETRPDFISLKEIEELRSLGVTMVELGVQSIYENILKKIRRGHGLKETIKATRALKDAGMKVLYQIMPNLPGSSVKKDEEMFKSIFENPDLKPDLLKIYPCAVMKGTELYKIWKEGKYKPYSRKEIIGLIKKIKKITPYYVRIQRITRDIPSCDIAAGPGKISNLRQDIGKEMKKEKWQCKCIRCREVRANYNRKEKLFLFKEEYLSSEGKEIFLSFENKKREKLYSLLRLRIPSGKETLPFLSGAAIIRELHTYGQAQLINGSDNDKSAQHKGLGKKLIEKAENIAKKEKFRKIAVISGVGAREYYRKLGYKLEKTYMAKNL